ncbi:MAG: hypothetical protein AAFU79_09825, partial [Myxococcota bacterium]
MTTDPRGATRSRRGPRGGYGPLSFSQLLDMLEEAGAVDATGKRDLLGKEASLRAKFLRAKYGPQALKTPDKYTVSATEIVDAARIPHPDAPDRTIDEDILAQLLAQARNLPYKKIDPLELDMGLITKVLPKGFAERHLILPLEKRGEQLIVAIPDPFDTQAVDEFALATGRSVQAVVSAKRDILNIINQVYGFRAAVSGAAAEARGPNLSNLEQLVRVRSTVVECGVEKILHCRHDFLIARVDLFSASDSDQ